jgi:hypothetical protein
MRRVAEASAFWLVFASISFGQEPETREPVETVREGSRDDLGESLPYGKARDDPIGLDRDDDDLAGVSVKPADAGAGAKAGAKVGADAAGRNRFGPMPPEFRARAGEVITAAAGVRETRHRVSVEVAHGLANVSVQMRFESVSEKPAEIRYRLALPPGAGLSSFEVCSPRGCRDGVADRSAGPRSAYDDAVLARGPEPTLPVAHAASVDDDRGPAFIVRAAPVARGSKLEVKLSYVAAFPLHGGVGRIRIPARGMDPRTSRTELTVSAADMTDLREGNRPFDGLPLLGDPWEEMNISARYAEGVNLSRQAWQFECGSERCARIRVAAAPDKGAAVDLVLAIDTSPSTIGPARGRIVEAVALLLAAVPGGSRVRALSFAATARPIVANPVAPEELPLSALSDAVMSPVLGSATRFESAWELARAWLDRRGKPQPRPLVVVVSDGGLTGGRARPFQEARRAGIEVSVLNVGDREAVPLLRRGAESTGGVVVGAGAEAEEAARGRDVTRLEQRLNALFAPTSIRDARVRLGRETVDLGPLRAGRERVWEGVVKKRAVALLVGKTRLRATAPPPAVARGLAVRTALAAGLETPAATLAAVDPADFAPGDGGPPPPSPSTGKCDPRGPAWRHSGISSDAAPVALAEQRACAKPPPPNPEARPGLGKGMPAEPLLSMLRNRIIPVARRCFRRDRAGRPDYRRRATFVFKLAEREVVYAAVQGKISERLRQCLLAAVDTLDVPPFDGNVIVRYPLVTESEPPPNQIELTPETARQVDGALGRPD